MQLKKSYLTTQQMQAFLYRGKARKAEKLIGDSCCSRPLVVPFPSPPPPSLPFSFLVPLPSLHLALYDPPIYLAIISGASCCWTWQMPQRQCRVFQLPKSMVHLPVPQGLCSRGFWASYWILCKASTSYEPAETLSSRCKYFTRNESQWRCHRPRLDCQALFIATKEKFLPYSAWGRDSPAQLVMRTAG